MGGLTRIGELQEDTPPHIVGFPYNKDSNKAPLEFRKPPNEAATKALPQHSKHRQAGCGRPEGLCGLCGIRGRAAKQRSHAKPAAPSLYSLLFVAASPAAVNLSELPKQQFLATAIAAKLQRVAVTIQLFPLHISFK